MNGIKYLIGSKDVINTPMQPFNEAACEFTIELSNSLMHSKIVKQFSDIISFAFWCRKSNINRLKQAYSNNHTRLGRGLVFHITPSNVPVNFAFSFIFSLLAGNSNIVRVPSKQFSQIEIICNAVNDLLANFPLLKYRNAFVSYPVNNNITEAFSLIADARMIWGGDSTVQSIRVLPVKPRCSDLTFADRYSICVINGRAVLDADDTTINHLSELFFNDTYLMDQNACSSPQLILWLEDNIAARVRFWSAVIRFAKQRYVLHASVAVDKYVQFCENSINIDEISEINRSDNLLYRVELSKLPLKTTCLRGKGGYFFEYAPRVLEEICEFITEEYQTITYFGLESKTIQDFVVCNNLRGIDRIVPIGSAMDIGVIWDGYDIISQLSRIVDAR
jgi:hypothetical protein